MPSGWGGRGAARLTALTLATYGNFCHLCGKPGATTADHIIPRLYGGEDSLENLRPAHKRCNSQRGTLTLDEWFKTVHLVVDDRAFFISSSPEAPRTSTAIFSGVETKRDGPETAGIPPSAAEFFGGTEAA